eukprot:COSAG05_NODE_1663_length_4312_cov_16.465243_5_plen_107_part_00
MTGLLIWHHWIRKTLLLRLFEPHKSNLLDENPLVFTYVTDARKLHGWVGDEARLVVGWNRYIQYLGDNDDGGGSNFKSMKSMRLVKMTKVRGSAASASTADIGWHI